MKEDKQYQQQTIANLKKKIDELNRINKEHNARWTRYSPIFIPKNDPPPKLDSNVPAFVPKPEKLPPKILKLPKDPKPEPKSNLRY